MYIKLPTQHLVSRTKLSMLPSTPCLCPSLPYPPIPLSWLTRSLLSFCILTHACRPMVTTLQYWFSLVSAASKPPLHGVSIFRAIHSLALRTVSLLLNLDSAGLFPNPPLNLSPSESPGEHGVYLRPM